MNILIEMIYDSNEKQNICETTLITLPLWFGIPESNAEYASGVRDIPFYNIAQNNESIGFVSIRENSKYSFEIYVMGIKPPFHRKGFGELAIRQIENEYRDKGYKLFEVKTLDESRESEEYRKTREFYNKIGFMKLEVIKELWGDDNPCLIMVKSI